MSTDNIKDIIKKLIQTGIDIKGGNIDIKSNNIN